MDDLDDRERIEKHVSASGAFLLLLSKGYLTSRLPLREVRCAISQRKPMVRVIKSSWRVDALRDSGE